MDLMGFYVRNKKGAMEMGLLEKMAQNLQEENNSVGGAIGGAVMGGAFGNIVANDPNKMGPLEMRARKRFVEEGRSALEASEGMKDNLSDVFNRSQEWVGQMHGVLQEESARLDEAVAAGQMTPEQAEAEKVKIQGLVKQRMEQYDAYKSGVERQSAEALLNIRELRSKIPDAMKVDRRLLTGGGILGGAALGGGFGYLVDKTNEMRREASVQGGLLEKMAYDVAMEKEAFDFKSMVSGIGDKVSGVGEKLKSLMPGNNAPKPTAAQQENFSQGMRNAIKPGSFGGNLIKSLKQTGGMPGGLGLSLLTAGMSTASQSAKKNGSSVMSGMPKLVSPPAPKMPKMADSQTGLLEKMAKDYYRNVKDTEHGYDLKPGQDPVFDGNVEMMNGEREYVSDLRKEQLGTWGKHVGVGAALGAGVGHVSRDVTGSSRMTVPYAAAGAALGSVSSLLNPKVRERMSQIDEASDNLKRMEKLHEQDMFENQSGYPGHYYR